MNFTEFSVEDIGTSELVIVAPETTIIECAKLMHDLRINRVIVASSKAELDGISIPQGFLTDHAIVVEVVAFSLDPAVLTAGDIMLCPLVTARQDEALHLVHERMMISELSSIVVVDSRGALVGLLEAEKILEVLKPRSPDLSQSS